MVVASYNTACIIFWSKPRIYWYVTIDGVKHKRYYVSVVIYIIMEYYMVTVSRIETLTCKSVKSMSVLRVKAYIPLKVCM